MTYEELVEYVARAICMANGRDPDAPRWIHYPGGHTIGITWHGNRDAARAALAEIRRALETVTPKMDDRAHDRLADDGELKDLWLAMLHASPLEPPK